jgi:electron transfer flavoprotein alpha/beta subunit
MKLAFVKRELEAGFFQFRTPLPAVLTIQSG